MWSLPVPKVDESRGGTIRPAPSTGRLRRASLAALLLGSLLPAGAAAQLVGIIRVGGAWAQSSDLELERPGGTDLTLHDVAWQDKSSQSPIYYDLGLTWWLPRHPHWGIGVDFTHAKAILDLDVVTLADGTLNGVPFRDTVQVREIVQRLDFSHGLNLITAGAYRRWVADAGRPPMTGVALYLGLGLGVVLPHVAASLDDQRTDEYQLGGPAVRGVIGIDAPMDENISFVAEGVLSWADVRADLTAGDEVRTQLLVPQLSVGLSLRD